MSKSILKGKVHTEWGESYIWKWKGFSCNWRVIGEGNQTPILLIHGFGASSGHWRNNVKVFSDAGYKVYAIDLIGFGESEQPNVKKLKKLDNLFWANQINGFLEEVIQVKKYGKAILIGNSLGALTAITAYLRKPELISSVVASPLPDIDVFRETGLLKNKLIQKAKEILVHIFFRILPLEIIVPVIANTRLIIWGLQAAYKTSIKSDHDLIRIVSKPAKKKSAGAALRAMCLGMSLRDTHLKANQILRKIADRNEQTRILILWGKNDKLVPFALGKKLMNDFPWIKFIALDKTGHCPHDESPDEFNFHVLQWLKTSNPINN